MCSAVWHRRSDSTNSPYQEAQRTPRPPTAEPFRTYLVALRTKALISEGNLVRN